VVVVAVVVAVAVAVAVGVGVAVVVAVGVAIRKDAMDQSVKVHRMPITLWRRAKSLAALAGLTISEYVINALREAVEKK